jgi:hypothetical protein
LSFGSIPDLLCHAENQSNWHSFIACDSDIMLMEIAPASASVITDIRGFARQDRFVCFIIFTPFCLR